MKFSFSAILLVFLMFFSRSISAQTWELGGFVGSAGYMGDLNPVKPYELNNLAFGGHVKHNIDGYWSVKFNVTHGEIEAADAKSGNEHFKSRNLSFFSPVTELSLQTEFNFFNYIPSVSRKQYSPYLFAGVGFVTFNPKTVLNGEIYELSLYGTEGQDINNSYKKLALSVPFGAGFKYNFAGKWSLGTEIGYRSAYTDYLDDVSRNYVPEKLTISNEPDFTELRMNLADRSPEVGYPRHTSGTQRGDYRKKDTYLFVGFTISYTFFTDKCPVVDN